MCKINHESLSNAFVKMYGHFFLTYLPLEMLGGIEKRNFCEKTQKKQGNSRSATPKS
jgi:hypothetical protein